MWRSSLLITKRSCSSPLSDVCLSILSVLAHTMKRADTYRTKGWRWDEMRWCDMRQTARQCVAQAWLIAAIGGNVTRRLIRNPEVRDSYTQMCFCVYVCVCVWAFWSFFCALSAPVCCFAFKNWKYFRICFFFKQDRIFLSVFLFLYHQWIGWCVCLA